jgi:polyisoprenyl-teichoic acid--peptidoglycan teichoic acid transferase
VGIVMSSSRAVMRKKRKKRIVRLSLLFVFLSLFAAGILFALDIFYSGYKATDSIYQKLGPEKNQRAEQVEVTKDPFTVLLVGLENQEGGKGRSDVIMMISVNPQTEEITMLSIPRDTRTFIPDAGYEDKITHSYGHNGIESTIDTVEEMINVPVDYFITTNFEGFEDIVDTLGGVTVDVPFDFKAQLTRSLKWKKYYQGEMDLNGNEALAYVRMRKSDPRGDIGRNERQQQVIKEIIDEGTSFSSITKIDDILNDLGENVKTNIPPSKFASFVKLYSKLKDTQINQLSLKGYNDYIDDVYYYIPDQESLEEITFSINQTLDGGSSYNSSEETELNTAKNDN